MIIFRFLENEFNQSFRIMCYEIFQKYFKVLGLFFGVKTMKNIPIYKKILDNNKKKCIKWQINKFFRNFIHNNFGVKRFLEQKLEKGDLE